MANGDTKRYRHILLKTPAKTEPFSKPLIPIPPKIPPTRDRQTHGMSLLNQIHAIGPDMAAARTAQMEAGLEGGFGLRVEFEGFSDVVLAFESLERARSGIEILNTRQEGNHTLATVFVPDGKLSHFEKLILKYIEERRSQSGRLADHKALINTIKAIRKASLKALWTDDETVFPEKDDEFFWWEVWLPVRGDRQGTLDTFRRLAEAQGFRLAPGEVVFPERTVVLAFGSMGQMKQSMMTINSIAELRRAKETEFFAELPPCEHPAWIEEMLKRTRFAGAGEPAPYVCLLDTGVTRGHPLLAPALSTEDMHTVEPGWGTNDAVGHGTAMAGLALAGNLVEPLDSKEPVEIAHRLESVKLLPEDGANIGDARHHGHLTVEAVSRPEVTGPHRRRVFSMAVTARDNRDRGRPSAWSATVDRLASDADGEGATPRLLLVSAGNIRDPNAWAKYPDSNSTEGIHDPGQAWNALTVGAYTDFEDVVDVDFKKYRPIAPAGGLSPFSTTSSTWASQWPLKPDVLFEGGNVARDAIGAIGMDCFNLLTCHHEPNRRLLSTGNATSAATALAARMAARLMAAYPEFWPETIRALIVHSARWTPAMRRMFPPGVAKPTKTDYLHLVRHCGFGVADLDRALWSASNSLTLVAQDSLHPFQREDTKPPKFRDMHLHQLPWPIEELESLGETPVEMRVTLSYFIDPNPSERGFRSRYSYESHGLRFDVKRPTESLPEFRTRINAAARDEEEGTPTSRDSDPGWRIGKQNRHKGSLHSDIWSGTAADLAQRGVLAVYPAMGWWKTRPALERFDKAARYALIISIHAPEVEIDLYSAVANKIAIPVEATT
jgi:hypothetical protein